MSVPERSTPLRAEGGTGPVLNASGSVIQTDRPPVLRRRGPHRLAGSGSSQRRPRTAFVLAGGASLGAMQVGMLRALFERGLEPDMLVGTSAGALNAAFAATRPPTVQTAKELAEVWRTVHRNDVFPIRPRTMIAGFASHRDHLVPDKPLRKLISRHLELKRLEHAAVPVHLVTSTAAPATTPAPSPTTSTAGGIPQGPGAGDQDADNNGGPSDGDGNI